jgi:hypothetical protein
MVDPASDSFPNLLQKLSSFDLPLYCHYCASSRNDDGRDTQRPFLSVERISHLTTHTTQHYRIGTLFISELNLTHSSHFHGWHLYNSAASCAKSYFCLVKAVSLRIALAPLPGTQEVLSTMRGGDLSVVPLGFSPCTSSVKPTSISRRGLLFFILA